ncbi:MAG: glycosyltransferase family 2 protein [Bacteroidales bacterium]|nr:glycosyltransferase family 2 protein [Bacteroidales bacterium]MDD3664376.1 glycosyltransferase family 2 protein [Bacteroidales bacterium]
MESKQPLVSIVTVNFNETESTCEMLESLAEITYTNIEVIVVDNDSSRGHIQEIKAKYPRAILVQSPVNYGFAGGTNYGIMRARGRYVLLLNNDAVVSPGFLEPLVQFMESNPRAGVVSPKIRLYFSPEKIQYAGATPINLFTFRNRTLGYGQIDEGQYDEVSETAFGHGAAMLIPMEVIRSVGMMSYAYFLYYEEADWCRRIVRAGYTIWVVPQSVVFHKESLSTGKKPLDKVYYLNRGRLIYLLRTTSGVRLVVPVLYQVLIAVPKNLISYYRNGGMPMASAYFRAIKWAWKNRKNPEVYESPML